MSWSNVFVDNRSEEESLRLDDDNNVDLEKSNILLMGPTGSGTATMFQVYVSPHWSKVCWIARQVISFFCLCYLNKISELFVVW